MKNHFRSFWIAKSSFSWTCSKTKFRKQFDNKKLEMILLKKYNATNLQAAKTKWEPKSESKHNCT